MKLTHTPKLLAVALAAFVFMASQKGVQDLSIANAAVAPQTGEVSILNQPANLPGKSMQPANNAQSLVTPTAHIEAVRSSSWPTSQPAPVYPTPFPTPSATQLPPELLTPDFQSLAARTVDGQSGVVKGVFVEGILGQPVLQQPENDATFVSEQSDAVTQFSHATNYGVIGLLAHNYLTGIKFYDLKIGQRVWIIYGDGTFKGYQINEVHQYQKLSPSNLRSDLIDLETNQRVTTDQVFDRFYRGQHHVTFQTCLENGGLSNWGLTFITATPLQ